MTTVGGRKVDPFTNRQERIKQWSKVPRLLQTGRLVKEGLGWYRLADASVMAEIGKITWEIRYDDLGTPTHVSLW